MRQHRDPLSDLFHLQDRMNRVFAELTHCQPRKQDAIVSELEGSDWVPAADIDELEKEYVLSIDLPGIEHSKLGIDIENDRLVVHGERSSDRKTERRGERPAGRFVRRFDVPPDVDQGGVAAEYKDGVLHVHLPKRPRDGTGRIRIAIT
jgi:HSP20 family protein